MSSQKLNIPEGWVLVPVEPTKQMRDAFHKANDEWEYGEEPAYGFGLICPDHQWEAMLRAAPKLEA